MIFWDLECKVADTERRLATEIVGMFLRPLPPQSMGLYLVVGAMRGRLASRFALNLEPAEPPATGAQAPPLHGGGIENGGEIDGGAVGGLSGTGLGGGAAERSLASSSLILTGQQVSVALSKNFRPRPHTQDTFCFFLRRFDFCTRTRDKTLN